MTLWSYMSCQFTNYKKKKGLAAFKLLQVTVIQCCN